MPALSHIDQRICIIQIFCFCMMISAKGANCRLIMVITQKTGFQIPGITCQSDFHNPKCPNRDAYHILWLCHQRKYLRYHNSLETYHSYEIVAYWYRICHNFAVFTDATHKG